MGEDVEHNDSSDYYPKGTYVHQSYYHKEIKKKIQLARHYSDPNEGSEASKSTAGVPAAGITKDEDSCT